MAKRSLVTRTLLHVAVITLLVAAVGSFIAYHQVRQTLIERQTNELQRLNEAHARQENDVFARAVRHHELIKTAFIDAYNSADSKTLNQQFDHLVERNIDGCWRSRLAGFDPEHDAGIWIDNDVTLTDELKWRVLVFQRLASEYGRAWRKDYLNAYFLAPENLAVPYWPSSPNIVRLLTADFDMPNEEYFRISNASNDPERKTVWTGLYADPQTKVWMVSIETPIYIGEKHLATIGNDITMLDLVARLSESASDGSYTALFRPDGRLIAHPQYTESVLANREPIFIPQTNDNALKALYHTVMQLPSNRRVEYNAVLDAYVFAAKLEATDWYFVRVVPRTVVVANVRVSAVVLLVLSFAMGLLTLSLLWWIIRRDIAVPVQALTRATQNIGDSLNPALLPTHRPDELGELAQQFARMHEDVSARDARLREHVMQLQVQQLRLQQAQWQAQLCSFELDGKKQQINVSDNFATLLHLAQIPSNGEELLARLQEVGLNELVAAISHLSPQQNRFHVICKVRTAEGARMSWDCQGHCDDDGRVRGVIQDISARQQIEAALRDSEARFEIAFEAAPIGFAVVSASGVFIRVNPKFCELLGYREEELIGHHILHITHPDDRGLTSEKIEHLQQGRTKAQQFEKRYLRKNGDIVWALVSSNVQFDEDGAAKYYLTQVVDITQHKHAEQELNRLAFHDSLTGLPNRALFLQLLRQAVQRVQRRPNPPFALLFLDLDGFKAINDNLGHLVGDELLLTLAGRLQHVLRPGDTVARFGGDEFCVLIDAVHNDEEINRVADRILAAIAEPVFVGNDAIRTSTSIGVVLSTSNVTRAEEYLRDADTAMYHAKKAGRNQVARFHSSMLSDSSQRLRSEHLLREALANREITPWYQCIVDARQGVVVGIEAQARWQHPQRGLLKPLQFLNSADEANLTPLIDFAVLEQSLVDFASWRRRFDLPALKLHWNVSAATLADRQLMSRLEVLLTQHALNGDALAIELTEAALIHDPDNTLSQLQRMREQKITIHLDDFGTGYSSLSYLHRFPIQQIKIDRSFVARMLESQRDRSIIESIVMMARRLELGVTAEGIECAEQIVQLAQIGVTHVQGIHISDVMPAEQMLVYLQQPSSMTTHQLILQ